MQRSAHIAFWSSAAMLGVVTGVVMLVYRQSGAPLLAPWGTLPAEVVFAAAGASAAIASALALADTPGVEDEGALALAISGANGGGVTYAATAAELGIEPWGASAPDMREISSAVHQLVTEFEAAKESQRRIVRGIGHDLRSPLASIVSMSDTLARGDLGDMTAEQSEACTLMADTARRLMAQSELLYALAEGRGDVEARRRERFDAREVVRPVVEGVRVWAAAKGIALELHMSEFPLQLISDRGAFERIAANLIDNAVKFTDAGTVRIALGSSVDMACFVVEDTGIGISEQDLEKVMTEYYRCEAVADRAGSGVGLAVCRELAEAMDGALVVHSELGKGSRFEVTLPIVGPREG